MEVLTMIGAITCVIGFFFFLSITWDLISGFFSKRRSLKQELNDVRWELWHAKNELQRLKDAYEPEEDAA